MKRFNIEQRKSEKGFTLVELAIVMIIIGVLLGGVLKGQEMITNARVTTTAKDMESFSAATNTFFDQYRVRAGELTTPGTRLADCNNFTACSGTTPAAMTSIGIAATTGPNTAFFGQLLAAGLISGFDGSSAGGAAAAFGTSHPRAPVGGGFVVGSSNAAAPANTVGIGPNNAQTLATNRLYLGLTNNPAVAVAANQGILSAEQGGAIDNRLDDGNPMTGYVLGQNLNTTCVASALAATAAAGARYTGGANRCVIFYRL